MKDIAAILHDDGSTVAVVGATDNPAKYGSVIYRDLKRKGFDVYPINPNRSTVDGDPAYPDLASLPVVPTIVNIVVPADETLRVLEEAKRLGIENVWVQPGAESPAVLRYLQEEGFNYLANSCIMVRSRLKTSR
jgi:predicted CoA-binding protein